MLSAAQIRETATNLRKLASDPLLKVKFSSATRKAMNDLATEILNANLGDEKSPK